MNSQAADAIIAALLAPFIGSFLAVLVVRLPLGEGVVLGRSRCRSCAKTLRPVELIPIVSWLIQKGRCASCNAWLGTIYPAMELAAIVMAVWAVLVVPPEVRWITVILGWVLLALAVMDARDFFLADGLTLPLLPVGLAVCWWVSPDAIWLHIFGALAGFTIMVALASAYKMARGRDGLGLGDAKLMASAGAWVGLEGLGSVLLYAVCVNVIILLAARRLGAPMEAVTKVPLGTGLAAGFWLTWVYGPLLIAI